MKFKIIEDEHGTCRIRYQKWFMLWMWGHVYVDRSNITSYCLYFTHNVYSSKYTTVDSLKKARAVVERIKDDIAKAKEPMPKPRVYYID